MLKSIFASVFLLSTFAAQATTYKCKEIFDVREEVLKARYSVTITELEDITDRVSYGPDYDFVLKVRVELKQTLGRQVLVNRSFIATANSADVSYSISAVRAQGFKFWNYLDEMDQAGIELTSADGSKVKVRMNCN